jgi:hypothetical protein
MAIQTRVRKQGPGFVGYVVCVLRGRRIWSESANICRVTREDAAKDAQWLKQQQVDAQQKSLA